MWFRSGSEIGRTVMGHTSYELVVKLLIRPVTPVGPGLATPNGQVAARHEASHVTGHVRDHQPAANHERSTTTRDPHSHVI